MTLNRSVPLILMLLTLTIDARAEIIEVRGEGYLNGEIVSETDTEVTFKPAGKEVRTIAKKDVLYTEHERKRNALQAAGEKLTNAVGHAAKGVKLSVPKMDAPPPAAKREVAPSGGGYMDAITQAQSSAAKADIENRRAQRRAMQGAGMTGTGIVGTDTDRDIVREDSREWDKKLMDKYSVSTDKAEDGSRFKSL